MNDLIDIDRLIQTLLESTMDGIVPPSSIAADLDVDDLDNIPFITHNTSIAQDRNGNGFWSANLTLVAHVEASTAAFNTIIRPLYLGVHSWDLPQNGIVPGVGAVERVEQDIQAFTRLGRGVPMLNKVVTPYVGSFELSIRNY